MPKPRPRIALIHAVSVAIDPILAAFRANWPEAEVVNLLDDSLINDRALTNDLTPEVGQRIVDLAHYARRTGAHALLFTCSAFGPAIDRAGRELDVPVLKPNEAMFEEAIGCGTRIGMLATNPPAVAGMETEFAEEAARLGSKATIRTVTATDALAALRGGDADTHNRLVAAGVKELGEVDAIVLAHFSTSRALDAVRAVTSKPVIAAPAAAVAKVRRKLGMGV